MSDVQIDGLTPLVTALATEQMEIQRAAGGGSFKITLAQVALLSSLPGISSSATATRYTLSDESSAFVHTATTQDAMSVTADALTTGGAFKVTSDSSSGSTRKLVEFVNDNTGAGNTTVLFIKQDAAKNAVEIDMNGNSSALNILNSSTTVEVINVNNPSTTTGVILNLANGNALTTGKIAYFHSNSASTSTRNIVEIVQDHASASNATALSIKQDSAAAAVKIQMVGTGIALDIDYDGAGSSNPSIRMTNQTQTTGNIVEITNANSLTTGSMIKATSVSTDTGTRVLVDLQNNSSASTGTTVLSITQHAPQTAFLLQQNQAANGMLIDQNGNGSALVIDSESTTARVLDMRTSKTTTGVVLDNSAHNNITTGKIAFFQSNSASASTRDLVVIENTHSSAVAAIPLKVKQNADQAPAISIDMEGNAAAILMDEPKNSTRNAIHINAANSLTSGGIFYGESNSSSTGTRSLMELINNNVAATGTTVLTLRQDSTGPVLDCSGGVVTGAAVDINAQTGTAYTLVAADTGRLVTMSNASANVLTIPANASVAFIVGTRIEVEMKGAGQTSIAITTDTLNSKGGLLSINGQYAAVTLTKLAATEWLMVGDLV